MQYGFYTELSGFRYLWDSAQIAVKFQKRLFIRKILGKNRDFYQIFYLQKLIFVIIYKYQNARRV